MKTYQIQVSDIQLRTLLDLAHQEWKNSHDEFYRQLVKQIEGKSLTTKEITT
jgi:hypothetical protein